MKYKTMRNIQLSLWPEEEDAKMSVSVQKLLGVAGRRLFIRKGIIRPQRAKMPIEKIKREEKS